MHHCSLLSILLTHQPTILLLDSIRLEILQLRADASAQQGPDTMELDAMDKGGGSSSLSLDDVELLERKTGMGTTTTTTTTTMKKKDKKAKKKKGAGGDYEGAEDAAESSLSRARRLLGITDRPALQEEEGDTTNKAKTKKPPRRRRGRTGKGADDDRGVLSELVLHPSGSGPGGSDDENNADDDDGDGDDDPIATNNSSSSSSKKVGLYNTLVTNSVSNPHMCLSMISGSCGSAGCYPRE